MADISCDHMQVALKDQQPYLVDNLELTQLFDHLTDLPQLDYIKVKLLRKDQVRRFLEVLMKQPMDLIWKAISCMFEHRVSQGHIALRILEKYKNDGGVIPKQVDVLRREYLDKHPSHPLAQPQPSAQPQPQPSAQSQPQPSAGQQHHKQRTEIGPMQLSVENVSFESDGNINRGQPSTSTNEMLVTVAQEAPSPPNAHTAMETDLEMPVEGGSGDSFKPRTRIQAEENETGVVPNVYAERRAADAKGVYRMESDPRGVALIINNRDFRHLRCREGTDKDCQDLKMLLEEDLLIEVLVRDNLTGQGMRSQLSAFAKMINELEVPVDCCVVAILTHGTKDDIMFGTDGVLYESGPAEGTFISANLLCDLFSSTKCFGMKEKPKLFITQACKGGLRDIQPQPCVPQVDAVNVHPDKADVLFMDATVPNFVAYRNHFIPILVKVIREHASTRHILDLQTKIRREMYAIAGKEFTISLSKTTLLKDWYLNPRIPDASP